MSCERAIEVNRPYLKLTSPSGAADRPSTAAVRPGETRAPSALPNFSANGADKFLILVTARELLVPFPGTLDNRGERLILRRPAKLLANLVRSRD